MSESVLVDASVLKVGDALPQREHNCSNVQLMLYNAALWNAHRIHFDEPYAKDVEGYPGLVVAGPLLGDWMNQCVEEWLGDRGVLTSIEYSNRIASYIGEALVAGGTVTDWNPETGEVCVEVFIRNQAGDIAAPGIATARLSTE
jgi:3-methylfumaryl-CoA hydratase